MAYDDDFQFGKVIDLEGIARLLRVSIHTPNQWRQRSAKGELPTPLPDPIPFLSSPLWWTKEIVKWAVETGRWPDENEPSNIFLTRLGESDPTPNRQGPTFPAAIFRAPDSHNNG